MNSCHSKNVETIRREQLFDNSGAYLDAMLESIQEAESEILLQTYIFAGDFVGSAFCSALSDAARRGVDVFVLVDGVGSSEMPQYMIDEIESSGGQIKIYHPFPWQIWRWQYSADRSPFLIKAFTLWENINRRNHTKLCVVDAKLVWIGSQNIIKTHMPIERRGSDWQDIGIRIQGIDTKLLRKSFFSLWTSKLIKMPKRKSPNYRTFEPFALNYSRWQRKEMYKLVFDRIAEAKKRVWLINAYFLPNSRMLNALKTASQNGCDVHIILPHTYDVAFVPFVTRCYYRTLLNCGIRLHEFKGPMLHAKSMIIDDWHIVGSSNLTSRSFRYDLELNFALSEKESKHDLETIFLHLKANSIAVSEDFLASIPWYKMLWGRVILFFLRGWF